MIHYERADASIDAAVLRELADRYGPRVTALPPVALVIAADNEERPHMVTGTQDYLYVGFERLAWRAR